MSTSVNWSNPYQDRRGDWLKGNLHTHTHPASGCGAVRVERVWDLYAKAGYDFIALSDHMTLSVYQDPRMVWLPGVEWNSPKGEHTGVYSLDQDLLREVAKIDDQDRLLAMLADKDALVVLNHPNWQLTPHYRREALESKRAFDGIEIFNHVITRLDGSAVATDKWDFLLVKGRRVLGFAHDDSHEEGDIGNAAINVRCGDREPATILAAIRAGNFYCTAGRIALRDIRREGNVVTVESVNGQEIHAIGNGGTILRREHKPRMTFDLSKANSPYVRFTIYGPGASTAWTQPFFV